MFRFSITGSNWIVRFSANLEIEDDEKEAIIQAIMQLAPKLSGFSHGESCLIFDDRMGVVVLMVEKIPALIVTVLAVIPQEQWFVKKFSSIEPYPKKK